MVAQLNRDVYTPWKSDDARVVTAERAAPLEGLPPHVHPGDCDPAGSPAGRPTARRNPLRRLAECPVKIELGRVVFIHRRCVLFVGASRAR